MVKSSSRNKTNIKWYLFVFINSKILILISNILMRAKDKLSLKSTYNHLQNKMWEISTQSYEINK